MTATLKVTRQAIGIELHRGTFDVLVDGKRIGSIELHDTIEAPVEAGPHTLQIRKGRYSSREISFEMSEGQAVSFRCNGARIWPIWLMSFVVPSLALTLSRE